MPAKDESKFESFKAQLIKAARNRGVDEETISDILADITADAKLNEIDEAPNLIVEEDSIIEEENIEITQNPSHKYTEQDIIETMLIGDNHVWTSQMIADELDVEADRSGISRKLRDLEEKGVVNKDSKQSGWYVY